MRLIFAGTPEFARLALQHLHAAGHDIALVLTQPDRPGGRGMKLQASAVKQFALAHHLPLCQPRSLRLDGKFPDDAAAAQAQIEAARADAMVVAAYGLILPQWVLDAMRPNGQFSAGPPQGKLAPLGGSEAHGVASVGAKFGCLNIHASLLPRWRGAAPIHRAIEAGDSHTGITIMQMDAGLDTGAMLLVEKLAISPYDSNGDLHDKLALLGAQMIVRALDLAASGALAPVQQAESGVTYAKKIDKSEAAIDWQQDAQTVVQRILAFNPVPGASSTLNGEMLKIWRAQLVQGPLFGDEPCGQILATATSAAGECAILVKTLNSAVNLTELQRPGGKRLPAADFLRGASLKAGDRFAVNDAAH